MDKSQSEKRFNWR